jgi:protein-S-isoprenylcysteine O-methyltransferase Ste14
MYKYNYFYEGVGSLNKENIIGLIILVAFYGSYFTKAFLQSRNGIRTDRMGKGSKPKKTLIIEICLKISTILIALIQLISIIFIKELPLILESTQIRYFGFFISSLGVIIFITAMVTMRDSWRAGVDNTQKTTLINTGIYKFSRNPAFLGFDLLYIGFAVSFSNIINILFTCFTILIFHLQILEEEQFLPTIFGKEYLNYKNTTSRYLGTKNR